MEMQKRKFFFRVFVISLHLTKTTAVFDIANTRDHGIDVVGVPADMVAETLAL